MDTLDLLLHPVRLRVVHTFSGDRTRTTTDLCVALPDVPKTTVYRHVGLLADAGVLEVVDERRVHGAVERHYRLRRDQAGIDAELAAAMSPADHRRGFAAAMAALHAEFNAYLDREGADPTADSAGYRQATLWLNQDELAGMITVLRGLFADLADNEPTRGRSPYLVSPIFFPTGGPPASG
ncbi:helix-turn-helix domain-containing protein [Actinokineospora sp. NBRC 105648]|uniref:helix-turn-helix domain-containing protein n=1 Tax=Actinokineospora sp. NBRC 105648 TaxID=3032206 RepID=UPI00255625CC|nr:helix-turn-helix domain-containing protein [Actinokineospora sp. NBRC 105648]